jgi:hypothetical protein
MLDIVGNLAKSRKKSTFLNREAYLQEFLRMNDDEQCVLSRWPRMGG